MAKENSNHFILQNLYPDIKSILSKKKVTIEEVSQNALFVMDTNSLLAPYNTGKKDIEQIKKVYKKLIKEGRLFIPAHVLREFARNRSIKIGELYTNIDNSLSKIPSVSKIEYPILSELNAYKDVNKVVDELKKQISDYKKKLEELKNEITNWNWSDPVSSMYSHTFSEDIIIDTKLNEAELLTLYDDRIKHNIPPGNKDKDKGENAIGDLVIWMSILELGKSKQRDIIFVSNDEKNDWMVRGNSKAFSTRFELVDEFYRYTEGGNFISMNFSHFLESQGLQDIEFVSTQLTESISKLFYTFKTFNEASFDHSSILSLRIIADTLRKYLYQNISTIEFINDPRLFHHIDNFIDIGKEDFSKNFGTGFLEAEEYYERFTDILLQVRSLYRPISYNGLKEKLRNTDYLIQLENLVKQFLDHYRRFDTLFKLDKA